MNCAACELLTSDISIYRSGRLFLVKAKVLSNRISGNTYYSKRRFYELYYDIVECSEYTSTLKDVRIGRSRLLLIKIYTSHRPHTVVYYYILFKSYFS